MAGIRLRTCAIALLLALTTSATAQLQPASSPPIESNRASDAYAIYSLLISGGIAGNHSPERDHGHQMTIANTTISADDMNPATEPDSELQPPPESEQAFYQAVQDFRARRQERAQLEHRFKLDSPYTLLSAPQVAAFSKSATAADSGSQEMTSITRFSKVYFNTAQNAALVYTDSVCANPCSDGQWIYLEKRRLCRRWRDAAPESTTCPRRERLA